MTSDIFIRTKTRSDIMKAHWAWQAGKLADQAVKRTGLGYTYENPELGTNDSRKARKHARRDLLREWVLEMISAGKTFSVRDATDHMNEGADIQYSLNTITGDLHSYLEEGWLEAERIDGKAYEYRAAAS